MLEVGAARSVPVVSQRRLAGDRGGAPAIRFVRQRQGALAYELFDAVLNAIGVAMAEFARKQFVRNNVAERELTVRMVDYGSHRRVLEIAGIVWPVRRVVEFGAGRHSTPLFLDRAAFPKLSLLTTFHFAVGPVTVSVPKPRSGASRPGWVPLLKRAPDRLKDICRQLWLRGLSSRDLAAVSPEVAGRQWSHESVNGWVRDVAEDTMRWLNRPVRLDIRYVVLDALYVPFVRGSSRREALLVALGVTETATRTCSTSSTRPARAPTAGRRCSRD